MARTAHNLDYQRHPPSPLGPKHGLVLDDGPLGVLDESILDRQTPDMSPMNLHRRESYVDSAPGFSTADIPWSDYSFNTDAPSVQPTAQPFGDHGHPRFMQPDRPLHDVSFPQQASSWQGNGMHEPFTPSTAYDDYTSDGGEKNVAPSYAEGHMQPLQPNVYRALSAQSDSVLQPSGILSVSPRSGQDWMSTSSSDNMELRPAPDHPQLTSPTFNTNPPLLRRDGIRKKNARFEIPAERTLRTIDHLINQTCDEQEIKELKQQKRLLRNRQAASVKSL